MKYADYCANRLQIFLFKNAMILYIMKSTFRQHTSAPRKIYCDSCYFGHCSFPDEGPKCLPKVTEVVGPEVVGTEVTKPLMILTFHLVITI